MEPRVDYTLIYYPDPWPGEGLICFGSAAARGNGKVQIKAIVDMSTFPNEGAKIWLVLSDDVACGDPDANPPEPGEMIGWNPTEYLFEHDLM